MSVLIYCHPRKFDTCHWQYSLIAKEIEDRFKGTKGSEVFVDTVDTIAGGTYKEDGFSDVFINKHKGTYDLVFLPDCGGLWYKIQSTGTPYELISLIDNIRGLLKPSGTLFISKILDPIFKLALETNYGKTFINKRLSSDMPSVQYLEL